MIVQFKTDLGKVKENFSSFINENRHIIQNESFSV